jgi:hypothetical protein
MIIGSPGQSDTLGVQTDNIGALSCIFQIDIKAAKRPATAID